MGNNMFAYCRNNPVCYIDSSGAISYTCLGDNHIFSDKILTAGYGGGSSRENAISTSKQASEEVIERELRYLENGTYESYIETIQDRYAIVKLGNGLWKITRGIVVTLAPDPTFITDISGAVNIANGLRLIVSALLEWTD